MRAAFTGGIAIVVASDVHFQLGRLLSALADRREVRIRVERDAADAERWLANWRR